MRKVFLQIWLFIRPRFKFSSQKWLITPLFKARSYKQPLVQGEVSPGIEKGLIKRLLITFFGNAFKRILTDFSAKPVDPYEQLKRSASSKNVRHVPEDNQNILLPNNGNQGQTAEPKISVEVISSFENDQNLKNDKTDASLVLPQVTR